MKSVKLSLLSALTLASLPAVTQAGPVPGKAVPKPPFVLCESETSPNLVVEKKCLVSKGEQAITYSSLPLVGDIRLNGVPTHAVVHGVIGEDEYAVVAAEPHAVIESFGFSAGGWGLENEDIVIAPTDAVVTACGAANPACVLHAWEVADGAVCEGDAENPIPPQGKLCIYPVKITNAVQLVAKAVPDGHSQHGFAVEWQTSAAGATAFRAVWAYRE